MCPAVAYRPLKVVGMDARKFGILSTVTEIITKVMALVTPTNMTEDFLCTTT